MGEKILRWVIEPEFLVEQRKMSNFATHIRFKSKYRKNMINEEQLKKIADSFSNMCYELVFIADVIENRIIYMAKSSGLARRVLKKDFVESTLTFLVETVSGRDVIKLDRIMDIIQKKYSGTKVEHRQNLLFMTDFSYVFDVEGTSTATYKFTPLESQNERIKYMLMSISFSVGHYRDRIFFLNTETFNREIYDFNKGACWAKLVYDSLTPVELTVLALSAEGKSVPNIAKKINKANDTVKSIRKRIFTKLGVSNITEAIMSGINHKII